MGRYAFFSTGLEYKFAYGIQDSFEMRKFAGIITTTADGYKSDTHAHAWSASRDKEYILEHLQNLITETELTLPDFSAFEPTIYGTLALRSMLESQLSKHYKEIGTAYYTFELGCMIYHQLLYEPELSVRYEVGYV